VSSQEETYAQAGDESEASEAQGVEEIEAKESLSREEREQADAKLRSEIELLVDKGEMEPIEELFEEEDPGTRAGPGPLRLSRNFVVSEFHCKDAQRTPVPAAAVPALRRLARQVLQPMRNKFGTCTVHSGFRTDAKNAEVGGASQSQHLYHRTPADVAADVTFATGSPSEWATEAERLLPNGGVGRYATFVHVDNRTTRARWTG